MSTGNIESWSGNMAEIGPLYPFVGAEFALFVVGMVLWILWHVRQAASRRSSTKKKCSASAAPNP